MSYTIPAFILPATLDSDDGPHLRVTYTDLTTVNVTLGTSGGSAYWFDSRTGGEDLADHIEDALNAATSDVWEVEVVSTGWYGRIRIEQMSGAKTPDEITCLTTSLTLRHLGRSRSNNTPPESAAYITTSAYRSTLIWTPEEILTEDEPEEVYNVVTAYTEEGAGVVDDYGGREERAMLMPIVWAALVWDKYALDTGHRENVPDMPNDDNNATLQSFVYELRKYSGRTIPVLRVLTERDDEESGRDMRALLPALYTSPRGWAIEHASKHALRYVVQPTLALVPTT